MTRRIPLILFAAALLLYLYAVIGLLTAASAARQVTGSCVATFTFDSLQILSDTDDTAIYPGPDKWTIHTYPYLTTASGGTTIGSGSERNFGVLKGSAGDTITVGYKDLDHVVIGQAGEDVTFKMPAGLKANRAKETDAPADRTGFTASDVNPYGIDPTVISGCTPGSYPFSAQDDIPETSAGTPDNADALIQLNFTLVLENN